MKRKRRKQKTKGIEVRAFTPTTEYREILSKETLRRLEEAENKVKRCQ